MRSAASRGFSAIQSRSVTSASSAAYSVALSIGTPAKVLSPFLAPGACAITWSKAMQMCFKWRSASVVHAVIAAAAVERIGEQHGVVDRRDADAVADA